jgi:hypothetical protein
MVVKRHEARVVPRRQEVSARPDKALANGA